MRKVVVGALLCALALVSPALAQDTRAVIEGVVRDAQGGVLPGATVEATNLTSGATVSTTTDDTGNFRFNALAPGRYNVTSSLSGFVPARVDVVEATLGQIKRVEFDLKVGGLTEEIQVTAESPLVDVKQSARSTNIREEQLELLPRGRDFTSVVTQAAGANSEVRLGGLSIDGASAGENRFIVDGVETTNLQDGTSGRQMITDFVEEVQVKSSGYTAEFGGATGGVVNVITKSGTNTFTGTALYNYEGSALSGGRYTFSSGTQIGDFGGVTATAPLALGGRPSLRLNPVTNQQEYVEYPEDDGQRQEIGFNVGGPIARNKAWFWAGYQPTFISYTRDVTLLNGTSVSTEQKDTRHFIAANQTTQFGNSVRTKASFNNSHRTRDGLLANPEGTDPVGAPYGLIRKFPGWAVSGQLDWTARTNLFLSARAGYNFTDITDEDYPTDPRFLFSPNGNIGFVGTNGAPVPPSLQQGANFSSFPSAAAFVSFFDKQKRFNFQSDATWYVQAAGSHQFKGGIQIDDIGNEVLNGEAGNRVQIRWGQGLSTGVPVTRGPFGYYSVRSNGVNPKQGFVTEGNVSTTNIGLFFQDSWSINNRLTFNAGVRTERERVPAYGLGPDIPQYGIEFDFADKLAPRLGMAWDLKGDGRWKTFASWGMFYDIFKLELPRGSFGGDKWLEYYYTLDTPDWPNLVSASGCPPACAGTLIRGPIDFRHPSFGSDAIEPDLKPMRMQEATVGLEHQLAANMAASVKYVHKQIDRAIEDTGSLDAAGNEIYIIANPGEGLTELASVNPPVNLPKPKRDYDAVEFAFDKRYSDNWSLRLSYLWSRLHGNYSGLSQGDESGRTSPNVGRLYDYPAQMFDETGQPVFGPLPTDRPHQFKAQALYSFTFGTSIGANYYLSSGVPVTREIGIYPPNNFYTLWLGRGSDGRTDVLSQTDIYVQHEFRFAGDKRVQVSLNVLNLFDQSASLGKWQTYQLGETAGVGIILPDEALFYTGQLDFDQLIAQQGVIQDPRFLRDSWYQFPIAARFGVKFIF